MPEMGMGRTAMAGRLTDLRAGDVDRAFLAERLKKALDEGRLTLAEYDERVARIHTARTYGELDQVVADLPSVIADARAATAAHTPVPSQPTGLLRYPWWAWLIGSATIIIVAILLLAGLLAVATA